MTKESLPHHKVTHTCEACGGETVFIGRREANRRGEDVGLVSVCYYCNEPFGRVLPADFKIESAEGGKPPRVRS